MITFELIVSQKDKTGSPATNTSKVVPSDPLFKPTVLERNLRVCRLKPTDRVKIRKNPRERGVVETIETDIENINWHQNRPHFIRVRFDDGRVLMCNLGQLKKVNS